MASIPPGYGQHVAEGFGNVCHTDDRDPPTNTGRSVERPYHGHSSSFSAPRRSTYHNSTPSNASQVSSLSSDTVHEPLTGPPRASTFSVPRKPLPAVATTETSEVRDVAPGTPFLGEKPRDPAIPPGVNHAPLRWRPFYLRRPVLFAFAFLFALLIGVAQGLLAHSKAANGLGDPENSSRYLWQFGGTAVMTLVMALWARVEYQIKVAAPWIRLSRGPSDPRKTLLVDYISDFQPVAIVKAFRYGDYLVGSISLVSILLRVLIITATAVISPSFIGVVKPETSVTLQKSFVNSADPLRNVGSMPHFSMAGLVVNNLTYPDGTSKTHSYQPFAAPRGSSSAEVEVTVDGLTNSLDCEPAEITLDGLKYGKSQWTSTNLTVSLEGCDYELKFQNQGMTGTGFNDTYRFFFMPQGCNGSDEPDDMRIVVGFTQIKWDFDSFPTEPWASNEFVNGTLGRTTQLVCKPNYAITDVRVVKNGTELVSIKETDGDTRTLSNVHAADIMAAHFESYPPGAASDGGPYEDPSWWLDSDDEVESDTSMTAAMRFRMLDTNRSPEIDELLDAEYLTKLVQEYYKQYTVFITRGSLMEEASLPATGRSTVNQDRLVARSLPVHLMTGLLVPCLLITLAAIFFVPKKGILPQAPTNLINVAALLANSTPLLKTLQGTGPVDTATLRQRVLGSQYSTSIDSHDRAATGYTDSTIPGDFKIHGGNPEQQSPVPVPKKWVRPPTLNFASRAAGLLIIIGMIATLEILLRKSHSENGVADVRNDDSSIFWTTALPATLLGLLAFYYSIADNTIRTLSPFVKLKRGKPFQQTVALDLLDKSRPRIVWSAAMASEFAVLSSTMAVLVASTLTIFSSALYRPVPIPITADASIPTMDYFAASDMMAYARSRGCNNCHAEAVTASLILGGNLTYPPFTYEDLAFQTLDTNATDSIFPGDGEEASMQEMVVSMTLPALRSRLSCRLYSPDDIATNLTLGGYDISDAIHPLRIDTPAEACGNEKYEDSNAVIPTAYSPNAYGGMGRTGFADDVVFGIARSDTGQCSEWFYAWGSLVDANSNDTTVTNVGAMGCNETMEVVDVEVKLYGPELDFDPSHPPEVDETSAREVVPDADDPLTDSLYPWLANATSPEIVDQFFSLLISSRYAIPPSFLGDPSAAEEIAASIRKQHRIIRAQDMNFNRRMELMEDGAFPSRNYTDDDQNTSSQDTVSAFGADLSPEEAVPSIQGRATSQNVLSHQRRVVQDGPTTRVLQALLSSILVFAILSWIFTRDDRVPRSDAPLSIASMGSLLVDGNVLRHLPQGAEWMRGKNVEELFKEGGVPMAFIMGWNGERKKTGLFSMKSFVSFGSGKKGVEQVREASVASDEYSSAYGSLPGERSYGIRVFRDNLEEGLGVWGWLRRRKGYVPGRKSEP